MKRGRSLMGTWSWIVGFCTAALLATPALADQECTRTNIETELSGDNLYGWRICNAVTIDRYVSDFDMDEGDWDHGFGWEDPCNVLLPFARTMNALWVLQNSSPSGAAGEDDYSGNILRWGYTYAAEHIDELDAACKKDGPTDPFATTHTPLIGDHRTELFLQFFYNATVVERAGTLLHESRHAGGKSHNGGADCPRKRSCDSEWAYNGANTYQVTWLWWYWYEAVNTTQALRDRAKDRGNEILSTGDTGGFVTPTGIRIM